MRIAKLSLKEVSEKLKTGEINSQKLINEICDRVEAWEKDLHALLPEPNRRQRLLAEMAVLEKKYRHSNKRPPLFGIPVGVKDLFRVDGFDTRVGSLLPPSLFAGEEAVFVTKLKKAGALILGKTVTTEFAYFEPGPTRNPHNIKHTPGGSSSGSAVAVAAGYCPVAFGTQTIGSITRPAAYCGIVGYKPSFGRIPSEGLIPFSVSADHVGFFTQEIDDVEICAAIVCDQWQKMKIKLTSPLVLGVPVGKYLEQAAPETLDFFNAQIKKFQSLGHVIKKFDLFGEIETINQTHKKMIAAEMAKAHKTIFEENQPLLRPATQNLIVDGLKIPHLEVVSAITGRLALRNQIEQKTRELGVAAWLTPATTGAAPLGISSTGSPIMNLPWTYAGVPTVTIPAGKTRNGLPMALQFANGYMEDEKLIKIVSMLKKQMGAIEEIDFLANDSLAS